jgi:hypothetical protein
MVRVVKERNVTWLNPAVAQAVVALAQLFVVAAALAVARLAKVRAAYLEAQLDAVLGIRSESSSNTPPPPGASNSPGRPEQA